MVVYILKVQSSKPQTPSSKKESEKVRSNKNEKKSFRTEMLIEKRKTRILKSVGL